MSTERIRFRLTLSERDLMLRRLLLDPDVEQRLRRAKVVGPDLEVGLTLEDVEDLAGHVAAEANHCPEWQVRRVLEGVFDRLSQAESEHAVGDGSGNAVAMDSVPKAPAFTAKQGQYLAFIYYYTKIHHTAPAEADLQRYFRVSAPAVHQMILTLEARGLIERTPGEARSIRLRVPRAALPDLE